MIKSRVDDNCLSHQDEAKRSRFVLLGLEGIGLTRNLASQLCFFFFACLVQVIGCYSHQFDERIMKFLQLNLFAFSPKAREMVIFYFTSWNEASLMN